MHVPSARSTWSALLAVWCVAGCASSTAPKGWLPKATEAQSATHGGWLSFRLNGGAVHEGEFLGIQRDLQHRRPAADSIFILERGAWFGVATTEVASATLWAYDANYGPLAAWAILGTLSTPSHGVGMVISAPVWIVVGTAAASSQSHAPRMTLTPGTWESARAYARFPQGLPPGLDRSSVRPK